MRAHFFPYAAVCAAVVLGAIGCGHSDSSAKPESTAARAQRGAPVTVAAVAQENVPVQLKGIGNVETIQSVAVRAQVQGQLERVYFQEGQDVKKGDMLFLIDPRTYTEAVAQAEGNMAREVAAVHQAEANVSSAEAQARLSATQEARYKGLADRGIISREQYDEVRTTAAAQQEAVSAAQAAVQSARANVRAAQAAVGDAKVRLSYTEIRSPITGRTGNLNVRVGNLVTAGGETTLVTINQISPIYVSFALPEVNLADVQSRMRGAKLAVEASPQGGGPASSGVLTFVDNNVDQTTGTFRCKATFTNESRQLWPGQFVNVVLNLQTLPNALVVPSQAVQAGQNGSFVYVVRPDLTAEMRPVVSRRQYNQQAIIDSGLRAGERVITDGQLKVTPGAKVDIVTRRTESAAIAQ